MKDLILAQGALAYYDSFNGLIPCRVLSVRHTANATRGIHCENLGEVSVQFLVTANRPGYKLGEVLESNGMHIVPRGAIYRHNHIVRIKSYTYEVTV